jgi:hypothetical protein
MRLPKAIFDRQGGVFAAYSTAAEDPLSQFWQPAAVASDPLIEVVATPSGPAGPQKNATAWLAGSLSRAGERKGEGVLTICQGI